MTKTETASESTTPVDRAITAGRRRMAPGRAARPTSW